MSKIKKMQKVSTILLGSVVAVSFSGCLSSEAPKCSSDEAIESVKSLYIDMQENVKSNPYAALFASSLPKEMTSIESIRPVSYDENIKMRSCKATAKLENGSEIDIEYTIQLNEENSDEYYVELSSSFLEALMMQNMMKSIMK